MSIFDQPSSFFLLLLFIKFCFFFSCCFLIWLIFPYKIIHIRFCFCEFHFIHTFSSVPMEESLSSEHSSKLFCYSFKHFLNGCWVSYKCNRHFKAFRRNITDSCFNIVRDPLNKVWGIFILYVEHLFVNFFRRHTASENCASSKISSMSWIRCTHHVFGIKHLLCELWYSNSSIYLRSSWCKWSKSYHKEMKSWERNKIYTLFSKIRI